MTQTVVAQRRLAAVLVADMVGYTRLMEAHEEYTYQWQTLLRAEILDPSVSAHGGRMVKNTGDGFLATFDSARAATECALELQQAVADRTVEQPIEQRISFRMAVNVADIIMEDDDVYGDGVNVTSRLQTYAEPGSVVISGAVAEQLGGDLGVTVTDLGDLHLHNIVRPVRVLSLRPMAAPARLVGDGLVGAEPRPSIAVLPFRMHPIDPEERYFADGIIDNIINALAALKDLFVISRGTAVTYAGPMLDVRAIGRELGVRYVLYGSARRLDTRLRIVTELSDTETGTVIRSDQHEGSLNDLFELQEQIVVNVVKTIAPHIHERELVRAMRKHPQNMTAYDLVLQALDQLYRVDYESFSRARGLLQQAIAHDPGYAPAHYYTAYWYVLRVGEMGSSDPDSDATAAVHHAGAAMEHDSDDALSLAIAGHVHSFFMRDYSRAISLLDRAIAAGPSSSMAWSMSSVTRGYVGESASAVQHAEHGVRLSALDARLFWHEGVLGQAYYLAGDYERALEWARSSFERNASIRFNIRLLIATLVALGRMTEAAEMGGHLLRMQPDFRIGSYAPRCPFPSPIVETWLTRLRLAGLPQ
jgi:class 3 adenylate cyclase/TolB-like protein